MKFKIFEQLGITGNNPNAILRFRDNNPINKGTIGAMDRIQAIRAEDATSIKQRIDNEIDNLDIVDNNATSEESDKEKEDTENDVLDDKEINAFGKPLDTVGYDTPLDINSDPLVVGRDTSYPYGFGHSNIHFNAGQNESLNNDNVHMLGELLINQYYIWKNGGQSKFNLNLKKYISTNKRLITKFTESEENGINFGISGDDISFKIECKDDGIVDDIKSSLDNLIYRLDRYKENLIHKKEEFEQLKNTEQYKLDMKSKYYPNISKEWSWLLQLDELCSNIEKYKEETKSFLDSLDIKSRYDFYKVLTESDIYKKISSLSDIYDVTSSSFIKDFSWDIDELEIVSPELNSKIEILNELSNHYYNMGFEDMFKTNKRKWKSCFLKYDSEIKDYSNEIFK